MMKDQDQENYEDRSFGVVLALIAFLIVLFTIVLAIGGCKVSKRAVQTEQSHVLTRDTVIYQTQQLQQENRRQIISQSSGRIYYLPIHRQPIAKGQTFDNYAENNASRIYDFSTKKTDSAAGSSSLASTTKNEVKTTDSTGHKKGTSRRSDSTAKANLPWYAFVIIALVVAFGLYLGVKKL